jgi:hypothetical protein
MCIANQVDCARVSSRNSGHHRADVQSFKEFGNTSQGKMVLSDQLLYLQYYTAAALDSLEAFTSMVLPDKKQLPNVL